MSWSNDYVGLPSKAKGRDRRGVDCWGLPRLVLIEAAGAPDDEALLPDSAADYAGLDDGQAIAECMRRTRFWPWTEVQAGQEKPFDLIVFHRGGVDDHMGIVVEPGLMLHIEDGKRSCVENYRRAGKWANKITGFYRHEALA